ncbi:AAA family ATPase [Paenarthrobacter nitroguajacolicus]|uniref:AAA family ATPase n=1 Tax=Paenarthrobacter nitroguajacolicus TaxID=211146 RepID=UPI003AEE9482
MSRIISLQTTNYKRLKAVRIQPDQNGNLVVIGGNNGQGKSSILDSITAALGGVNAKTTPKPIRDGEERAEIILETEDLIVVRRFAAGGSTLTVKSPDGAVYPKGQAKLDDLLGKLSLDPLAFTQLSDKEQLATLLDLVELPFSPEKLAAERKKLFDARADVGRQGKAIGDVTVDDSLPTEETSASEIIAKIRQLEANARARAEWASGIRLAEDKVSAIREQIKELTAELAHWESTLKTRLDGQEDLPPAHDTAPLEAQLASVEDNNAAIRANNAALSKVAKQAELRAEYNSLSDKIQALDQKKADGLAKAKFPIDDLGFDESGVTYQGVPFKQASSAEQLRVSLAMAIALNPKLRVIRIADGSLLDKDNLALVESIAREHDFQVWIEVVGDGDGRGIIIEDGEVKE